AELRPSAERARPERRRRARSHRRARACPGAGRAQVLARPPARRGGPPARGRRRARACRGADAGPGARPLQPRARAAEARAARRGGGGTREGAGARSGRPGGRVRARRIVRTGRRSYPGAVAVASGGVMGMSRLLLLATVLAASNAAARAPLPLRIELDGCVQPMPGCEARDVITLN